MNDPIIIRRELLTGVAGILVAGRVSGAPAARQRVLRFAYLTDVHVYAEKHAAEGMSACLRHVQSLADKPEMILFGGDCIMDAYAETREQTQAQWNLWDSVLKAENSLPYSSCIGNHDIWGWDRSKSKASGNEPDFGKKWAVEALKIPARYYSFDKGGWRIVALDSIQPGVTENMYSAYVDEEQLDWLKDLLAKTPATTPVLIFSHAPIASALPLLTNRPALTNPLSVGAGQLHTDCGKLVNLLSEYPSVKACLSGHVHQVEHLEIKGVHYHCLGAVSGAWWKGKNNGFAEGYAVIDLFDDGSYDLRYQDYGWRA